MVMANVGKVSDCVRSQRKIPIVSDFYVPFVPVSDSRCIPFRLTKTKDQDKIEVLMVSSPNRGKIQKLERCAATLLMGCSSGSLSLNGSYIPKGAPLHYMFAQETT
ncbi:putative separase [Helianthus debilis subsp. tardiflorus]